jgi:hypothetical protein
MTKRKPSPSRENAHGSGDDCIDWIEANCWIPEGKDLGKPVVLREWQKELLRTIYDNPHGTRRAIISFGRTLFPVVLSKDVVEHALGNHAPQQFRVKW